MEKMNQQWLKALSFSPKYLEYPDSWVGHLPFAAWLISACKPEIFVELGTHSGNSYFSFCQAVKENKIQTKCYAVDSWKGEEHAGTYGEEVFEKVNAYNQRHYGSFSKLMRMQFDEAVDYFSDGSIELLHIDGLHTYEAVKNDFETWVPKLATASFVIFHDINVREQNFGVWRLWEEIKEKYPLHIEFLHSHGLGVLYTGDNDTKVPWLHPYTEEQRSVQLFFQALGEKQFSTYSLLREQEKNNALENNILDYRTQISEKDARLAEFAAQFASEQDARQAELAAKEAAFHETEQLLRAEIASLQQACNEVTQSRSWRITKPLRVVAQGLRRKKKLSSLFTLVGSTHHRILLLPKYAKTSFRLLMQYRKTWPSALRKAWAILQEHGLTGLYQRIKIVLKRENDFFTGASLLKLYGEVRDKNPAFTPKVSIIVPNYNHAPYLRQRLDCIYAQTYKHFQVILLDDCSTDGSVEILQEYTARHADKTILKVNKTNSGSVFHQWKRGIELADGDLVWIAESDDYCTTNFLEELVKYFQNSGVMLAFCRTDFVQGSPPKRTWTLEEYLHSMGPNFWKKPFISSTHALVKNGWAEKNIIPNVSSALFRRPQNLELFHDPQWMRMRLCGDWIFYLTIARGGLVAYSPLADNFYRQHPQNTSVSSHGEDIYIQEHGLVIHHLARNYNLDQKEFRKQEDWLYDHWLTLHGPAQRKKFDQLYSIDSVQDSSKKRHPNVVMAVYALTAGGGETFPIILANLLHKRGYAVTVLNCQRAATEKGVRNMLSPDIPLIGLETPELAPAIFADMGVELVHSHHAVIDTSLSSLLLGSDIPHVVTMHGMYEMMTEKEINSYLPALERISSFVYISKKNLHHFPESFLHGKKIYRIDNALPSRVLSPISKTELGIPAEDFILCLVSRAIPEKGWEEAVHTVNLANQSSPRKIHLLLIGDGPEHDRLKSQGIPPYVHLLGFKPNVCDYFATADLGFLPSRFQGESAPLVLIECLLAGTPMFASNLGEIAYMLNSDEGMAGEVFDLQEGHVDSSQLAKAIVRVANDPQLHAELRRRVPFAAAKFEAGLMTDKYEQVYRDTLALKNKQP